MGVFQSSSMLAGVIDAIKKMQSFFNNLPAALNGVMGRGIYYTIICGVGRVADICQLIFRKFAGVSSTGMTVNGQSTEGPFAGDVALSFLESPIVRNMFFALLILAIVLLLITTFVAVIRTEFAKDGNNNKRKAIKHAFRGLVNFIAVPVVSVFALMMGNVVLRAIDGAISSGSSQYISYQIFISGAYNGNRARNSENNTDETGGYDAGSFGALLAGTSGDDANGFGNFGIFLDDKSGTNRRRAADKIDMCFANGYAYKVGTGLITGTMYKNITDPSTIGDAVTKVNEISENAKTIDYSRTNFYNDGWFLENCKVEYQTQKDGSTYVNDSDSVKDKIVFKTGDIINFSPYNVGLVYYYYDLNLFGEGCFNYLIGGIAMVFATWTLLLAVLGLIKRVFMIVTLFVVSAPICAIYPLDEGKALERWRTEFIKEVLAAYSLVVVMNLFLSLLPIFSQMDIFVGSELGALTDFGNYFGRVLVILGGLTFFKGAAKTIANIIGAGDILGDSDQAKGAFKANVGRVVGVGAALGALGKSAAKGGKKIGEGISSARDNSFAKKHAAEAQAQLDAMGDQVGKASNTSNPIDSGKNGMNPPSNPSGSGPSGSSGGPGLFPTNSDGSIDWHKARKAHYSADNIFNRKYREKDKGKAENKFKELQKQYDNKYKDVDRDALVKENKLTEVKEYDKFMAEYNKYDQKANHYDQYRQDKKYRHYDQRQQALVKTKSFAKGAYDNVIQPIAGPVTAAVKSTLKGDWKDIKSTWKSNEGTAGYQDKQKKAAEKAKAKAQEDRMNKMAKDVNEINKNTKK